MIGSSRNPDTARLIQRECPAKVSVIIPSFNRHDLIGDAVRSILETGYPALEIVIVDDGSRHETFAAVKRLEEEYPGIVRVLRHPDKGNHGQGAARNLGIARAAGEYVCFLDQDDRMLPHRFATSVRILDADRSVDGVYEWTQTRILDGGESRIGTVRSLFSFDCEDPDRVLEKIVTEGKVWHTPAILLRKAVVQGTGGFSDANRYCEDLVLWLKLACTAKLVKGSEEPVAVYHVRADNISTRKSPLNSLEGTYLAYLEAYAWGRKRGLTGDKTALLKKAVSGQLFHACAYLRNRKQPDKALIFLMKTVTWAPSFIMTRKFWTNVISAVYEWCTLRTDAAVRN